jgi:hypothetical protein
VCEDEQLERAQHPLGLSSLRRGAASVGLIGKLSPACFLMIEASRGHPAGGSRGRSGSNSGSHLRDVNIIFDTQLGRPEDVRDLPLVRLF